MTDHENQYARRPGETVEDWDARVCAPYAAQLAAKTAADEIANRRPVWPEAFQIPSRIARERAMALLVRDDEAWYRGQRVKAAQTQNGGMQQARDLLPAARKLALAALVKASDY